MSRRFVLLGFVAACHTGAVTAGDAAVDAEVDAAPPAPDIAITATVDSTRFVTREHMLASGEMQISGEPLAEQMGRDLGGFSRDLLPVDIYVDPVAGLYWIDLAGFSTAVESYEYSKQPMNALAFELGAGTALAHGPLVAPGGLAAIVQRAAQRANALGKWVFAPGTFPANNPLGDVNPNGLGNPADNPLGWPGIWPTVHVFRSFDPAIDPTNAEDLRCSIASDDNPSEMGEMLIGADYECSAASLHLRDRAAQTDRTITPGADGFATWKYGLWVINYLQIMHDAANAAVASVDPADLAAVGTPGNTIVGTDDSGAPTAPGTYLGSSDIEGFQAQLFLHEVDNRAEDWLLHLTTANGATLSGFASRAAALHYSHTDPLRWFPSAIAVTETADPSGFPRPSYALASANSALLDLVGLAMGYAEVYALTDANNRDVGGSQPAAAMFDGDPFAAGDPLAPGDPTLHDRALAMIRVAVLDIDRLHVDPASQLLVDDVAMTGTTTTRGHTISTLSVAYTVIGLRTVLRSLSSQLELYSNNTPDTAVTTTPLDAAPIGIPGVTFSARTRQLLEAQAALLYDHLTDGTGRAYAGWDVTTSARSDPADRLDAHTAAVRGLFAAYLATGDVRYRVRALAVYERIEHVFYDPGARIYGQSPAPVDAVTVTPLSFALLQSTLRDVYELVATRPGYEALVPMIENRLGRLNKLVLNGWDDRDRDKAVDWPGECVTVVDGLPRGGLQMAERTLTGEIGRLRDEGGGGGPPTSDREADCVPEIDDAHLPAALAASVTFHVARLSAASR